VPPPIRDVVDGAVYREVDGEVGVRAVVFLQICICELLWAILQA
jgi:hypothetical protein